MGSGPGGAPAHPPPGDRSRPIYPCGKARIRAETGGGKRLGRRGQLEPGPERNRGRKQAPVGLEGGAGFGPGKRLGDSGMRGRHYFLIVVGAVVAGWGFYYRPFPPIAGIPPFVIMDIYYPNSLLAIKLWYYALPGVAVSGGGLILLSLWRVYFEKWDRRGSGKGKLPTWPLDPEADGPSIVVGEVHHPGRRPGGPPPLLAHYSRAGTLYRSRHLRGRGIGQDFGLHAPLRLPASRLAGRGSGAAGGGPGPGSQGRLLP